MADLRREALSLASTADAVNDGGGPASSEWEPPPAFDDFLVVRQLGRGGMGQVYLGHDKVLDRPVALKFIAAHNTDPRASERFHLEARAIARLSHPNVVSVFRIGDVLGRPYIAYEFVLGESLDRVPKPVAWQTALHVGLGIARGLSAAHRSGVLHRDIKPANVMLRADGEVKLLDFGLAKLVDRPRVPAALAAAGAGAPAAAAAAAPGAHPAAGMSQETLQIPGMGARGRSASSSGGLTDGQRFVGTPLYLAPELWRGGAATVRSDVYALGLLMYELCAGRLPQAGLDLFALARRMPSLELPPLRSVCPPLPEVFAEAIDRCVRLVPEERYQSAEAVHAVLEAADAFCRAFRIGHVGPSSIPPASEATTVSASFERIGLRIDALVARLYDRLFEQAPELRALFPEDLMEQRAKLAVVLRLVVDNLRAPDRLDPMLEELGRKHAAYGVSPAHLDAMGRALCAALAEFEGDAWKPATERAWTSAYARIAGAMRRGLGAEAPAPPAPTAPPRPRAGPVRTSGARYVSSAGLTLAYQVFGDGPLDLVLVQGWVTHLEAIWEHAAPAAFLEGLASSARLILFDQRGTGMSERDGAGASPEQRMHDLRAVLDAASVKRAALLGVDAGATPCALFAAAHPERTAALLCYGSAPRMGAARDAPYGLTQAALDEAEREIRSGWRQRPLFLEQRAPSMAGDRSFRTWWASYLRLGATAGGAIRMLRTSANIDIRRTLPSIRVPALVLHREGDKAHPVAGGRDLAARIPGARFIELPGDDHLPFAAGARLLLLEIKRFLAEIARGIP
jgi:serine/threonine protein kinase/pimeloyl-ACP methyl ester carboxylesterase